MSWEKVLGKGFSNKQYPIQSIDVCMLSLKQTQLAFARFPPLAMRMTKIREHIV